MVGGLAGLAGLAGQADSDAIALIKGVFMLGVHAKKNVYHKITIVDK